MLPMEVGNLKKQKKIISEPYNQFCWTSLFTQYSILMINGLLIIMHFKFCAKKGQWKQRVKASVLCALFIEKRNDLDSMQNRLKDADEKNSILLRTLNETLGKLSAIPNGKLEKCCNTWFIPALLFHFQSLNICLINFCLCPRCVRFDHWPL